MARTPFVPQRAESKAGARVLRLPRPGERRARSFVPWTVEAPAPTDGDPAEDPVETARREAERAGYDEGFAKGKAEAEAQAEGLLEGIRTSLDDLARLRATLVEVYRRELAELALSVARALVLRAVEQDRSVVEGWIDRALASLGPADDLVVRCAPDLVPVVESWIEQRPREDAAALSVVGDPAFGPGDLRIDSAAGSVEMILERRLARVRDLVLDGPGEVAP